MWQSLFGWLLVIVSLATGEDISDQEVSEGAKPFYEPGTDLLYIPELYRLNKAGEKKGNMSGFYTGPTFTKEFMTKPMSVERRLQSRFKLLDWKRRRKRFDQSNRSREKYLYSKVTPLKIIKCYSNPTLIKKAGGRVINLSELLRKNSAEEVTTDTSKIFHGDDNVLFRHNSKESSSNSGKNDKQDHLNGRNLESDKYKDIPDTSNSDNNTVEQDNTNDINLNSENNNDKENSNSDNNSDEINNLYEIELTSDSNEDKSNEIDLKLDKNNDKDDSVLDNGSKENTVMSDNSKKIDEDKDSDEIIEITTKDNRNANFETNKNYDIEVQLQLNSGNINDSSYDKQVKNVTEGSVQQKIKDDIKLKIDFTNNNRKLRNISGFVKCFKRKIGKGRRKVNRIKREDDLAEEDNYEIKKYIESTESDVDDASNENENFSGKLFIETPTQDRYIETTERSTYTEPAHTGSTYTESTNSESTHSESTYTESTNSESTNSESTNSESTNSESTHSESTHSESTHTGSTYTESSSKESSFTESTSIDSESLSTLSNLKQTKKKVEKISKKKSREAITESIRNRTFDSISDEIIAASHPKAKIIIGGVHLNKDVTPLPQKTVLLMNPGGVHHQPVTCITPSPQALGALATQSSSSDDSQHSECHPKGSGPLSPMAYDPEAYGPMMEDELEDALTGKLADRVVEVVMAKVCKCPRMQKELGLYAQGNLTKVQCSISHPEPKKDCEAQSSDAIKTTVLQEISIAVDKLMKTKSNGMCLKPPEDLLDFLMWLLTEDPDMDMPEPILSLSHPRREADYLFKVPVKADPSLEPRNSNCPYSWQEWINYLEDSPEEDNFNTDGITNIHEGFEEKVHSITARSLNRSNKSRTRKKKRERKNGEQIRRRRYTPWSLIDYP